MTISIPQHTETFDFEVCGKKFSVPAFDTLPIKYAMEAMKAITSDDSIAVVEWGMAYFEANAPGCLDEMTVSDFATVFKAWRGGELGE